ncbi:CABYR protein, partial [Anseranas semipalmata]|nr:CABYR protein [Anseranas semipalmata]
LKTLLEGVSRAVIKYKPEDTAEFIALYFQELIAFRKDNPNLDVKEVVENFNFKYETLLSNEPQKREVSTDTEEDQLLEDLATEYISQITQCPSIISSIAENKVPAGPDEASSPEGPGLAYVPADPAQLAAHVLGNSDSGYSVRDVATSVQTLHEDAQTSENSFALVEGAAEDAAAASAAEASLEAVRSQPGVHCWSSKAGELGPSDSQADVSTNAVDQVSSAPVQEEPLPCPPPSLPSKEQLQAVPSCNTTEAISAAEGTSLCYDDKPIMDAEVP